MKHATISLGNAVIILGGQSHGNRLSTIGRHEIFFDNECSKALKSAMRTTEPLIFLKPNKLCSKIGDGRILEL